MPIERRGSDKPSIRRGMGGTARLVPVPGRLDFAVGTDAGMAALINDDASATTAALTASYVVKVKTYADLVAALAAATAGTTVVLTASVSGAGITIPADVTLRGEGCTFTVTSGSAGVTLGNRSRLIGLTVNGGTAVNVVYFGTSTDAVATRCKVVSAPLGNGFSTAAATRPVIEHCSTDGCYVGLLLNSGVIDALVVGGNHINGTAVTSYEGAVYIPNAVRATLVGVDVVDAAGHGAWIGGSSTRDVRLVGCTFRSCGTTGNDHRGVTIDSSCERITLTECLAEGNIANGFFATLSTKNIVLVGCVSRGNNLGNRLGAHGFEILADGWTLTGCLSIDNITGNATDPCSGFFLASNVGGTATGCHAYGNYGRGFLVYDGFNITLSACVAKNNSQAGVNTYDGFFVSGSYVGASSNITLVGCRSYDSQATKTQRYGASLGSGVTQYIVQACNFLAGGSTGTFLDGGSGGTKSVTGNLS